MKNPGNRLVFYPKCFVLDIFTASLQALTPSVIPFGYLNIPDDKITTSGFAFINGSKLSALNPPSIANSQPGFLESMSFLDLSTKSITEYRQPQLSFPSVSSTP